MFTKMDERGSHGTSGVLKFRGLWFLGCLLMKMPNRRVMSAKTHKITIEYHSIEAEDTSLSVRVLALFFRVGSTLSVKF